MATHNIHYRDNHTTIGLRSPATHSLAKALVSSVETNSQSDLNTATTILAYMLGLAALAVVAITGQFPWFLLSLASAGLLAYAAARSHLRRRHRSGKDAIAA